MIIIPAIDLHQGRCVRLYQGKLKQKTEFSSDPLEVARKWEMCGAKLLHVVDLDGAFSGSSGNLELVFRLAEAVSIPVELGGGLRTEEQVVRALSGGIERAILGTVAVENPALVKRLCSRFPGQIILGIDAKDGVVVTRGWVEESSLLAAELARQYEGVGIGAIIFTDTGRDGTLCGPNIKSLRAMVQATSIPVIASGGVSSIDDIEAIAQETPQVQGVILGLSLYSGAIDLEEAIHRVAGMSCGER